MTQKQFYYDPEDEGASLENSHPEFVRLFTEAFYYDCTDDYSPFGSDDGADILSGLEEWYQDTEGEEDIVEWLFETIDEAGFDYASEPFAKILDADQLKEITSKDPHFVNFMDNSIIGAAFGQLKITGKLSKKLKKLALIAFERQAMLQEDEEFLGRLKKMQGDLEKA